MKLRPRTTWSKLCVVFLAAACAATLAGCSAELDDEGGEIPGLDDTDGEAAGDELTESNAPGAALTWRNANLTNFTSYPAPGSEECDDYNGCKWAGLFAFVNGRKSREWVRSHNIAAVHSRHANQYKLKTLRLKKGSKQIDVKVYDMCADSDCNGCCTRNMRQTGFLIDIEKYTMQRFGSGSGQVQWACVDC